MSIDADSLATQNLKGKLDQAVMFSDRSSNPLAFDLKLESEGDLVWAAERLSKEILNSCRSECFMQKQTLSKPRSLTCASDNAPSSSCAQPAADNRYARSA